MAFIHQHAYHLIGWIDIGDDDRLYYARSRMRLAVIDDGILCDRAIGDDDQVAVASLDLRIAPRDRQDLPLRVTNVDPLTLQKGPIEENEETRNEVAQRILKCKGNGNRSQSQGSCILAKWQAPDSLQNIGRD